MLLLLICDVIIEQDVHFIFCILQIYSLSCNDIVTKFLALVQRELKKEIEENGVGLQSCIKARAFSPNLYNI